MFYNIKLLKIQWVYIFHLYVIIRFIRGLLWDERGNNSEIELNDNQVNYYKWCYKFFDEWCCNEWILETNRYNLIWTRWKRLSIRKAKKKNRWIIDRNLEEFQGQFWYNINLLLSINGFDIAIFYKQKFVNVSYLVIRLYIYILQQICKLKICYYFIQIDKKMIFKLISWRYLKKLTRRLRYFLRKVKITKMFIIYFIQSVITRDIEAILCCIRKIMVVINRRAYRQFLFTLQLFFKRIWFFLELYGEIRGMQITLIGKFGRRGSGRARKYLIYMRPYRLGNLYYYCYNYVQIRTAMGVFGLQGILFY